MQLDIIRRCYLSITSCSYRVKKKDNNVFLQFQTVYELSAFISLTSTILCCCLFRYVPDHSQFFVGVLEHE